MNREPKVHIPSGGADSWIGLCGAGKTTGIEIFEPAYVATAIQYDRAIICKACLKRYTK